LISKWKRYIKFKYPDNLTYEVVDENDSIYIILIKKYILFNSVQMISKTASNIKQIIYEYK